MRHHSKDTPKDARIITLYKENDYNYSLGISNPMTLALCRRLQLDHEAPYLCDFVTQAINWETVIFKVEEMTGINRSLIHIKTYLHRPDVDPLKGLKRR